MNSNSESILSIAIGVNELRPVVNSTLHSNLVEQPFHWFHDSSSHWLHGRLFRVSVNPVSRVSGSTVHIREVTSSSLVAPIFKKTGFFVS